ncbi:MAG: hypothetical protein ACYDDV_02185 [Methanoregula sp.]
MPQTTYPHVSHFMGFDGCRPYTPIILIAQFFLKTGLPTCRAIRDACNGENQPAYLLLPDKSTLPSGIKMKFAPGVDYQKTGKRIHPGLL